METGCEQVVRRKRMRRQLWNIVVLKATSKASNDGLLSGLYRGCQVNVAYAERAWKQCWCLGGVGELSRYDAVQISKLHFRKPHSSSNTHLISICLVRRPVDKYHQYLQSLTMKTRC
jgi:hypothetical protein